MKTYFKRLAAHPGVPIASFMTVFFLLAGEFSLRGFLAGAAASTLPWAVVLWTAKTQPLSKERNHE